MSESSFLGVLAILGVLGLAASCVVLALALAGVKDRKVMSDAIRSLSDRVCVGHEDQLARFRLERESDVAMDFNRTSRETARYNGTYREAPPRRPVDVEVSPGDE